MSDGRGRKKKVLGVTPRNYADALRQLRLKKALKTRDDIALATYEAGYGSSSRLYETSSRFLGMTPKAYQQHGKGQKIFYSVVGFGKQKSAITSSAWRHGPFKGPS